MTDPFAAERMRVRTALLEIERQKVKLLITKEIARNLRDHARATCAELASIAVAANGVVHSPNEGKEL